MAFFSNAVIYQVLHFGADAWDQVLTPKICNYYKGINKNVMVQLLDSAGNPLKSKMQASDTAHRAASHRARELSSWLPSLGSADSDLLGELPTLVSRSRDLSRNHGVAAGAIQTLTDNVVGTGLRLSATPDYRALGKDKKWADEWSRGVESQWRAWADSTDCDAAQSLNFAGLTSLVFRSSIINGETKLSDLGFFTGKLFQDFFPIQTANRIVNIFALGLKLMLMAHRVLIISARATPAMRI